MMGMGKTSKLFKSSHFLYKGHSLKKYETKVDPYYSDDSNYDLFMSEFRERISDRQDLLFADRRHGLLCLFQGMDTAGKDGAIKHVMTGLNPLGVQATAFSSPSVEEKHRDFLWRTHDRIPPRGKIGIFNRSYYEEVITVRVHPEFLAAENLPTKVADKAIWKHRFQDINNFEHYLDRQGIHVLKFFLHISKVEQKARLLSRIDDESKNWKFDEGDLTDRELWPKFMSAYSDCFRETSTKHAPWYIIPGDDKKNARLIISAILAEYMEGLKLETPSLAKAASKRLKSLRGKL